MSQVPEQSSPMILGEFRKDCRDLEEGAFILRHGEAFLLHHGPVGVLKYPLADRATLAAEDMGATGDRLFDPKSDFVVFRVKREDEDPRELLVWVGRSDSNDVVVRDASVSGVHAFFKRDGQDKYYLQDMSSTNGTFINGERVPAQGDGPKVEVQNGAQVVLGSVRMTFLYAKEFCSLVTRLIG